MVKKERNKDFKTFKNNYNKSSKGIGDTVEKITKKTGIKKVVKFLSGEDCGCDKRKETLNNLFPYHKPECFTEDEFNYLSDRVGKLNKVTPGEQKIILKIYNRVFHQNVEMTTCGPCFLNEVWSKIERIYKEYI